VTRRTAYCFEFVRKSCAVARPDHNLSVVISSSSPSIHTRYRSHRAERDIPSCSRALVASVERERERETGRVNERVREGRDLTRVLFSKALSVTNNYYYIITIFFFFIVTRLFIKFDHTSTTGKNKE